MTNKEELIWLAGLLEGEGHFRFQPLKGKKSCFYNVVLAMIDKDVVERASRIMGSRSVRRINSQRPKWSPTFRTDLYGQHAIALMKQILPFMGQRRAAKIESIIDHYNHRRTISQAMRERRASERRCKKTMDLFVIAS